jgi:hypothetical protein
VDLTPDGHGLDEATAALVLANGWPVHLRLRTPQGGYPKVACDLDPLGQVWTGDVGEVTCVRCRHAWDQGADARLQDQVAAMVREALADQHRIIEAACERALQGGEHGVLILRAGHGGTIVSAEPDPSVPYGMIHDRPVP